MKKVKDRINLQMFADLEEIITQHTEAFEGVNVNEQINPLMVKLNELGYEVLINNKQKAEFVPASRLGEVVNQRDSFKQKVEELNVTLTDLQTKAGDNQQLKDDYQKLIDKNNELLANLETTKMETEIMLSAKDAINPKDLLLFINRENISKNSKNEFVGIDAEIARVKQERPYLFMSEEKKKQFGNEGTGNEDITKKTTGMNSMIRKAAGRL